MKHRHLSNGFTLIEIMVTISVLAILIALATPSFSSLIERIRIESHVNALKNDIGYTRTEAMRIGQIMSICRRNSNNPNICATDSNTGWENGWIIYQDADNNNQINNPETPIRVHEAFNATITAQNNVGNYMKNRVEFSAQGLPNGGISVGCIKFCSLHTGCSVNNPNGRYLVLNRIGRLRIMTEDEGNLPANINIC